MMKDYDVELYKTTMERVSKLGAITNNDAIVILAKEIEQYRNKIAMLEMNLDNAQDDLEQAREEIRMRQEKKEKLTEYIQELLNKQNGVLLPADNFSDDETIITIRSREKVSSVDVYFQENETRIKRNLLF